MEFGLLGRKLGHSYSPQIHQHLGDYTYNLFEVEPDQLHTFFQNSTFNGINVTIPYKKDVVAYCDELSPIAQKVGAVNTIVRKPNGTLVGHNTDYFGFMYMLQRSGLRTENKKVLVLGSGGASVPVIYALQSKSANVVQISRSGINNYNNLHLHNDASVIVNATPVGMYPNNGLSPIDLDLFPKLEGVLDLIYNPSKTMLILDAEQRGMKTENGLGMLIAQAYESSKWFTDLDMPQEIIEQIYNKLSNQMQNIVLIGMPGCGKSTIGKILAEKTGRVLIDSDAEIEKEAGMSIPAYFEKYGEAGFRKLESKVLENVGKRSGCIIATGGGCVTVQENYNHLHQNGTIVWIQRDLNHLATNGRPLSRTTTMQQMYEVRQPLYSAFSDLIVNNAAEPDDAAEAILKLIAKE